jgi:hypothetical protein
MGARRQVGNHASSSRSIPIAPVAPKIAPAPGPVPTTVSLQTHPGLASHDANTNKGSQQPSIYHDAPPVATLRPDPDGSLYLNVIFEDTTMVFTTVPTAHLNPICRSFRPQHGFESLSLAPSDHRTLQSQVRNFQTQLAAAAASFRSPWTPSLPSMIHMTTLVLTRDDPYDNPCPDFLWSDLGSLYSRDDDKPLLDGGKSITSHASSIVSTSAAAAAPPPDVM